MNEQQSYVRDERLKCGVISLSYDFCTHTGQLKLPETHCCNMPGCVALFEAIDSEVIAIETYSGNERDTEYRRTGDEWKAYLPS